MSRIVPHTGSLTVYPSGYISKDNDGSWQSIQNPGNAYGPANSSNTSYSQIRLTAGSGANTYIYFTFDTSSIPSNATITSIGCVARIQFNTNTASYVASKNAVMCSGTTAKSDPVTITSTSVNNYTFTMNSWTRADLNDTRLKLYATRGTSNTSNNYYFRLYGATLTIEYSYNDAYYTVTASSSTSGVTVSPTSQEYSEGDDATVTISGATTDGLSVTDNNVDVSSSVVVSGSNLIYTIQNLSADHTIVVVYTPPVGGQAIFYKQNGSWVEVDKVFFKQNGSWKEVETLSIKQNGSWVN